MNRNGKLMEMLTGYAAAHQHPVNVFVHMIGIPMILLGVLIPLSWIGVEIGGMTLNLSHAAVFGFFLFYLTLDKLFAGVFLVFALAISIGATHIGNAPREMAGLIAACAFFGGFAAQFIGHAIEKAMPVLVRHPIQAVRIQIEQRRAQEP
jgi:uncharacterized membrane protein YGL010W